jgi:hypothetical protein
MTDQRSVTSRLKIGRSRFPTKVAELQLQKVAQGSRKPIVSGHRIGPRKGRTMGRDKGPAAVATMVHGAASCAPYVLLFHRDLRDVCAVGSAFATTGA